MALSIGVFAFVAPPAPHSRVQLPSSRVRCFADVGVFMDTALLAAAGSILLTGDRRPPKTSTMKGVVTPTRAARAPAAEEVLVAVAAVPAIVTQDESTSSDVVVSSYDTGAHLEEARVADMAVRTPEPFSPPKSNPVISWYDSGMRLKLIAPTIVDDSPSQPEEVATSHETSETAPPAAATANIEKVTVVKATTAVGAASAMALPPVQTANWWESKGDSW